MSELKAYKMVDEKYCTDCLCVIPSEVYLKSEADKVIARHKYKRCLAMASRCRLRGRLFGACGLYEKELWALKWHKRWLELAEKFKETK